MSFAKTIFFITSFINPNVHLPLGYRPDRLVYHKIRSGDTLGAIAQRYGTTVSKLCSLNGITSKTTLRIGRTLRVR